MVRNIIGLEQTIRQNKDETLHVFSANGDIVKTIAGEGYEVDISNVDIRPNSILTHNHPRAIGKTGIEAIGNSFSKDDIKTAVMNNAKEIRAVTPTYTFSVKRPKGGWGGSVDEIVASYEQADREVYSTLKNYINKTYTNEAVERANATHYHKVMKKMASKYGWEYSKKKG